MMKIGVHLSILFPEEKLFDMKLLSNLEFEILLGKLSFKEKADIYNAIHGDDDSACDSDEESENGEESGGGQRDFILTSLYIG